RLKHSGPCLLSLVQLDVDLPGAVPPCLPEGWAVWRPCHRERLDTVEAIWCDDVGGQRKSPRRGILLRGLGFVGRHCSIQVRVYQAAGWGQGNSRRLRSGSLGGLLAPDRREGQPRSPLEFARPLAARHGNATPRGVPLQLVDAERSRPLALALGYGGI